MEVTTVTLRSLNRADSPIANPSPCFVSLGSGKSFGGFAVPRPWSLLHKCAVTVPGRGGPDLERWKGRMYGHGKRGIMAMGKRRHMEVGKGGYTEVGKGGCRVMGKGGSAGKRAEQLRGSVPRGSEQGKACCPGGGDVRVSHGAPHAARWHLNLCLGTLAGTAARARCDTGVPGDAAAARGALGSGGLSKLLLAGSSHG